MGLNEINKPVLSKREKQVVEEIAWGADVQECADALFISKRTVTNHLQNIYDKIGVRSLNGLSAWYFCFNHGISFQLSPKRKRILSKSLLMIYFPMIINGYHNILCSRIAARMNQRQQFEITAI
jgi:DNA-binding CsgD family transcriptional regulator